MCSSVAQILYLLGFCYNCDTGTVILRLAVFPLFIIVQKNMVAMNNHMPTIQKMQEQFSKARRSGDILEGELLLLILCELLSSADCRPNCSKYCGVYVATVIYLLL